MKTKLFSGLLITLSIPVSHAAVTGDELNIGTGNVLMSGTKSAAIGTNNDADYGGVALGSGNYSGEGSLTSGGSNTAYDYSLAGGYGIDLGANSAVTLGFGESSKLFGAYASAGFGSNNKTNVTSGGVWSGGNANGLLISGLYNTIYHSSGHWGYGNIVLGKSNIIDSSITGGDSTINASVLIGLENSTAKTESWVIGKGNAGQTGTVTLGTYASTSSTPASLIVGTGTGTGARSNGLVVLKSGEVQIPSGNLLLGTEPALKGSTLRLRGYGASSAPSAFAAWGDSANASGLYSLAMGNHTTASGFQSAAIGYGASATGGSSIALGFGSRAIGDGSASVASGRAEGYSSIAAGEGARAAADYSVAMVYGVATGYFSFASGGVDSYFGSVGNLASGENSTSIGGFRNVSSGEGSFSSGYWTKATGAYSVALGSLNKGVSSSATTWVENDPLFELGNGFIPRSGVDPVAGDRSNAITTLKNGQTTLANKFWSVSTPKAVPAASDASAGEALVVEGHTVLKGNTRLAGKVTLEAAQGDISMGIYE